MRFAETDVAGAIVVDPAVHRDPRGFFLETFHAEKYAAAGIPPVFVQDNHSLSAGGTLRGLHMQILKPQGKLVRVIEGEIWDVALDVRPESPTFMRWTAATLSAGNFRQLYIPPGCAHGFCVMSPRGAGAVQVHRAVRRRRRDRDCVERSGRGDPVAGADAAPVGPRSGQPAAARGARDRGRTAVGCQGGLKTALYVRSRGSLDPPHRSASMILLSVGLGRITAAVFAASGW